MKTSSYPDRVQKGCKTLARPRRALGTSCGSGGAARLARSVPPSHCPPALVGMTPS